MKIEFAVYCGIGEHNKGDVTLYSFGADSFDKIGEVSGNAKFETVRIDNVSIDIDIPDTDKVLADYAKSLRAEEIKRHERRLKEINAIEGENEHTF